MSFTFSWNPSLVDNSNFAQIKAAIDTALAKGPSPEGVAGPVVLQRLYLGDTPPSIHIQAVEDVASDRVKAVFAMQYAGNASIALRTCVQANLLRGAMLGEDEQQDQQLRSKFNCSNNNDADSNNNSSSSNSGSVGVGVDDYYLSHLQPSLALALPHVLGALTPLALPLEFTIHDLRLSGTVSLVVTKNKGAVMVFDSDPLQSLELSSSLDDFPSVSAQLKREVEIEIREVLRDTIPQIVYQITAANSPTTTKEIPIPPVADPKHVPPPIFDFPFLATSALSKIKTLAQTNATLAALSTPSPFNDKKSIRPDRLSISTPIPSFELFSDPISTTNTPPLIIDFDTLSDTTGLSDADSDVSTSLASLLPPPSEPVSPRPRARRVINLRNVLQSPSSSPHLLRPSNKPSSAKSKSASVSPTRTRPHIDQFRLAPDHPTMISPANRPKRNAGPRRVVSSSMNNSMGIIVTPNGLGSAMGTKTGGVVGGPTPSSEPTHYFLTQQR